MFPTRIMHVSFYNLLLRILRSNALTSAHSLVPAGGINFLLDLVLTHVRANIPSIIHMNLAGEASAQPDEIARELFWYRILNFFSILKALFNNVFTFEDLSCMSLYMLSVPLIRCTIEALKKLRLKSTIKCFKEVKTDKWPNLSYSFVPIEWCVRIDGGAWQFIQWWYSVIDTLIVTA